MRLVVLLVACLLAAACTRAVEVAPAAPTSAPPTRPREVRLEGVDPCSLLTAEQRRELGLTSEPRSSTAYVGLFRGEVRTCTVRGDSADSALLGITAVTTAGIERWREGDLAAQTRSTTAAGFPALTAVPTQARDYCSVEVDVASGQLLDIQYGGGTPESPIPQDELCRRAGRSADAAMATLLKR